MIQFVMNGQLNFMLQHFKNFLGAAPEEEATVLFTLFVLFQLFNAFNCRELDDTPMCKNLLKNKLMLGVFLLVLILLTLSVLHYTIYNFVKDMLFVTEERSRIHEKRVEE